MNHTLTEHQSACLSLARTIRAHLRGNCPFANSIAAEFGLHTSVTQVFDKFNFMNPGVAIQLEDLSLHCCVDRSEPNPTPIAQLMINDEHKRGEMHGGLFIPDRRRRPMPPETRGIVLAYLDERIELFEQADTIISSVKGARRTKNAVQWQLKRLERLRAKLTTAWGLAEFSQPER